MRRYAFPFPRECYYQCCFDYLFFEDPSNQRLTANANLFRRNLELNNVSTHDIDKVLKEHNKNRRRTKRKGKYKKFYYTSDEPHWTRYQIESNRARELCRGETDPIVSDLPNLHLLLFVLL